LKGKTLQGESHERWGMKKDPKVLIRQSAETVTKPQERDLFGMRQVPNSDPF